MVGGIQLCELVISGSGGVNDEKNPRGLPSAVSSSIGGVLTRTAS